MNREEGEKRRNLREIQKRLNRKKKTEIGKEERNDNEKEKKRKKRKRKRTDDLNFNLNFSPLHCRLLVYSVGWTKDPEAT